MIGDISPSQSLHAVRDLGMDDSGQSFNDSQMRIESDTELVFPPGEYKFRNRHDAPEVNNFRIRGTGGSREDVRITGPDGDVLTWLNIRSGVGIHVENIAFDHGDDSDGAIGNIIQGNDNIRFRNVRHMGYEPAEVGFGGSGNRTKMNLFVHDVDGDALIDNYDMVFSGYQHAQYPGNSGTIFSGPSSQGTITIRNSRFANTDGNYQSRCESDVHIENCRFENIDNGSVRLGGAGTYVKNSEFVIDPANAPTGQTSHDFQIAMRWESGSQGFSGGLVENCTFTVRSANNNGVELIRVQGSHGGLTLRDCSFQIDANGVPILDAQEPGATDRISGTPDRPWDVTLDGCEITGSGTYDHALKFVGRDGSTVKNSCVQLPNFGAGIIADSCDVTVADSTVSVGGQTFIRNGGSFSLSNVSQSGSCGSTVPDEGTDRDRLVIKPTAGQTLEYRLVVDGTVEGDTSAPDFDTVTMQDGQTIVEGVTGAGGSIDDWLIDGTVTGWTANLQPSAYELRLNGETVSKEELLAGDGGGGSFGNAALALVGIAWAADRFGEF